MREMLKHATIADLHKLMETALAAESEDGSEADIMFAIVDELRERGELKQTEEAELEQGYADIVRRANVRRSGKALHGTVTQLSGQERLLQAVADDQRVRHKVPWRRVSIAVSLALLLLLTNTFTVKASGKNIIEVFIWTGQAIYKLFGGVPAEEVVLVHGEMQAFQDKLDELGISVALPDAVPNGYSFKEMTQVTDNEPFIILSWFEQFETQKEFSLKVDGSPSVGVGNKTETNTQKPSSYIEHNGESYSVFENNEKISVMWADGDYQMILQGDLSYDEAKAVIESIKVRNDT